MVQDYHYLNEHTVKNNYLLLLIAQLVNKLQGAKLFMKMDLRWGYNSVHIKENDEWKAVFTCFHRSFEPLIMYFRLCNLPTTFQAMMNEIFADMDNVVVIYINDLMISTKTENQAEHTRLSWKCSDDLKKTVTVGLGRNDRRPGDKGLSTKSFAYRRDKSWKDDRRQGRVVWLTTGDFCRDFLR